MKDYLGVLQLLRRFGIYVYTGNRKDDIDMVQSEVKDLYDNGLLMKEDYLIAVLILRSETAKL
ncbi:YqgQ family protein [Sporosarcina sp. E16_8]|uniref:YqgQ family protein n=1 Tax=Sporosarcina sp. E16_8 TaxID=2789295 RepID=UPI001A9254DB|nr:YqgQ family protein [Sporosarcina sp. E16_8]MBO0586500.1 YqgQ family protein [Sporosarcina sp. E16_8]